VTKELLREELGYFKQKEEFKEKLNEEFNKFNKLLTMAR